MFVVCLAELLMDGHRHQASDKSTSNQCIGLMTKELRVFRRDILRTQAPPFLACRHNQDFLDTCLAEHSHRNQPAFIPQACLRRVNSISVSGVFYHRDSGVR